MTARGNLQIRERRADELEIQVAIESEALPPDWHWTVEEARAREALEGPDDLVLRLIADIDGEPVAMGQVSRWAHGLPGRFDIFVAVLPRFQRRGIATALNPHLLDFAREHGARELEIELRETELSRVERWLEREGYREVSRMRESELLLEHFSPSLYADAERRARAAGITFAAWPAVESDDTWNRLWELGTGVRHDIPFDGERRPDEEFERFRRRLTSPQVIRACLIVARHGEEFVGYTVLARNTVERATTWTTGVHPTYRRLGIATALKVRSTVCARSHGFTELRTFNHTNNPAMLAVNARLGYVPLPEVITYVKQLG